MAGNRKPAFCTNHSLEGMVDINRRTHGHARCLKFLSYGIAGGGKPEFCAEHDVEGMVNVIRKKCPHQRLLQISEL